MNAHPLHIYPCHSPKNALPAPYKTLVVFHKHPLPSHVPLPQCKTHSAGGHKHTSNNKQLLLWVLLTCHSKLCFVIQCFWSRTSMNLKYQSSFEALIAPGSQASLKFSCNVQEFAEKAPPRKPWREQRLFCQLHLTAQRLPPAKALTCRSRFLPSLQCQALKYSLFKIKLI